jgi:small nuclear ribonucleoprotein
MTSRPLEALAAHEQRVVLVRMRSGAEVRGKLTTFDEYMNLSLEDAELLEEGKEPKKIGSTHVKGDNLSFIVLHE